MLHFKKLGEGEPLLILHGVFGSLDNWQTLGSTLSKDFTVYLIDLRNHGKSFHSDTFNYAAMADDIEELTQAENFGNINLMGHSMGGKVAMNVACRHSELVKSLIVVDISPKYYKPHHQHIFEGIRAVQVKQLNSRQEADQQMSSKISDFGIRQFILKNLKRENGEFQWKLNVEVIEKSIEKIGEALPENYSYGGPTLFIKGGKSDYITESDGEVIKRHFPLCEVAEIPDAGHWVHAEQPQKLLKRVNDFLQKMDFE